MRSWRTCGSAKSTRSGTQTLYSSRASPTEKAQGVLDIAYGDTVTAVSPPVFIWANLMRLTGTWCILATTYNTQPGNSLIMVQIEHTGLVPMAALVKHSGGEPIITHHLSHA